MLEDITQAPPGRHAGPPGNSAEPRAPEIPPLLHFGEAGSYNSQVISLSSVQTCSRGLISAPLESVNLLVPSGMTPLPAELRSLSRHLATCDPNVTLSTSHTRWPTTVANSTCLPKRRDW